MTVKAFAERLGLTVKSGKKGLENTIKGGYAGDLLSDVMANAPESAAWLTIQTHQNVVAVATLKDMACVVITGGNMPDDDTAAKSETENIPLLLSNESAFDLCMKIAKLEIL